MNILVCSDSFKGTLTSKQVCDIVESAIKENSPDCSVVKMPLADGGEGLCSALYSAIGGKKVKVKTKNPFNEDMVAEYLILDDKTAVIEMAQCAGLPLAGERANPLYTTTFGVGLMILDAHRKGVKKILLGLGGSSTNDCGIGMAEALGFRFLDSNADEVKPIGDSLIKIKKIIPPKKRLDIEIIAACDVTNPLYGECGAAYVFAPQKGADEKSVEILDLGLRSISKLIKKDLEIDVSEISGAGAAGGLGAGAVAFFDAELKSGIDIVLDTIGFDEVLKNCDVIITGEGKFDSQSAHGKVISGVCKRARILKKPVFALCGCKDENIDFKSLGIEDVITSSEKTKNIEIIRKTVNFDVKNSASKLFSKIIEFFEKST